jgi:hypothetical protein
VSQRKARLETDDVNVDVDDQCEIRGCDSTLAYGDIGCGTVDEDEALLARAERSLTEIKIAQGLSDAHASVLAALRIRLKGRADATLDELLESAGDLGTPADREAGEQTVPRLRPKRSLDDAIGRPERKRSLDDVLAEPERPKQDRPG